MYFCQMGHILNADKIFQHFFIIHMLSQIARIKDINVVCSSIKDLLYLLHNHVYIVSSLETKVFYSENGMRPDMYYEFYIK